jgi:putative endonuclease
LPIFRSVIPSEGRQAVVEEPPHFASDCDTFSMPDQAYVYITASTYKRLYIGVTSEIELRVLQHKNGRYPDSFTSRYRIDRLVHLERFGMVEDAIARETQLKKWSRIKKIQLVVFEQSSLA